MIPEDEFEQLPKILSKCCAMPWRQSSKHPGELFCESCGAYRKINEIYTKTDLKEAKKRAKDEENETYPICISRSFHTPQSNIMDYEINRLRRTSGVSNIQATARVVALAGTEEKHRKPNGRKHADVRQLNPCASPAKWIPGFVS